MTAYALGMIVMVASLAFAVRTALRELGVGFCFL